MSPKHDNCQNNNANVFGGSRGKGKDCEVCNEVKHERFQTGCDTVSFSAAQIKSPILTKPPASLLSPTQTSNPFEAAQNQPQKHSPLNRLLSECFYRAETRLTAYLHMQGLLLLYWHLLLYTRLTVFISLRSLPHSLSHSLYVSLTLSVFTPRLDVLQSADLRPRSLTC